MLNASFWPILADSGPRAAPACIFEIRPLK